MHGALVGWGTMLQTGRSPVQVPDKVDFFNPSNRTMALGSTEPLTENVIDIIWKILGIDSLRN
jgi:hypothetical protein